MNDAFDHSHEIYKDLDKWTRADTKGLIAVLGILMFGIMIGVAIGFEIWGRR